jgi:hypothetical protein
MTLLKEMEQICCELGVKGNPSVALGNQPLVLKVSRT